MARQDDTWDDEFDEAGAETLDELVDMNHPALREILAEAVNHPARRVRMQAALKLAELFADVRAVPGLAEALADTDAHLRRAASDSLWEIGDADTPGLLAALRHGDNHLRDVVSSALDQIGWQPDDPASEVAYRIAARQWRECIAIGSAAVPGLTAALRDPDWAVRRAAAWSLGEIGDPRAVGALIERLDDPTGDLFGADGRICDVAAQALEKIGTAEALGAVSAWRAGGASGRGGG